MTTMLDERPFASTPARLLVAIYGGEPAGWAAEVRRTLATWPARAIHVRVLVALDVPRPPFTSLLAEAARRYAGARAAWREAERARLESLIDALALDTPDVVWRETRAGDPVPLIVEHARAWAADLVVVDDGRSLPGWLAGMPRRLIRRAPCPVLVMPAVAVPRHAAPALAAARGGA